MITNKYLFTALLFSATASVQAAPIDPFTISSASGCTVGSTDCTVNWASQIYSPELAAVQVERSTGTSWLIRYNLYSPSASTHTGYDDVSGNATTSTKAYSGNAWLEAPEQVNTSGTLLTNFNVYTDQIDQNFASDSSYIPNLYLGMTINDTILNGSASLQLSGDPDYISSGDLVIHNLFNGFSVCVECGLDFTLNLNGLTYDSNGQLTISAALIDPGKSLLSYSDNLSGYYPSDYSTDRELFVSAVPVPAAFWLFSSGLLGLAGLVRRS